MSIIMLQYLPSNVIKSFEKGQKDMQMRRTNSLIEVLLSELELNKYNVTVDHMAQHKPFPTKIIEDLMEKAANDYDMEFDIDHCRLNIQRYGDMNIYISFVEKSNIVYLENDYIEEEGIVDGLQQLFQELPDANIHCGIMELEEKRKYLDTLRSKEGREIIRRELID